MEDPPEGNVVMKIQIVSDLHFEFGQLEDNYEKICKAEADVLILAGDITSQDTVVDDLLRFQDDSGKEIMFVPGNHEYYGSTRKRLDEEMLLTESINKKVHILLERDVCIGGVCFIGSTGWWDGSSGSIGHQQKMGLNDFRMVYDICDEGNLDGVVWGRKAQTYLSSRMYWLRHHMPDMKLCVITHHFPHHRSIHPHFAGSPLNPCFYNSWEWMIEKYRPEIWCHGHTHAPFDYTVGASDGHPHLKDPEDTKRTRVICNPQGYAQEYSVPKKNIEDYYTDHGLEITEADYNIYKQVENMSFNPEFVIEL
jgi:predicted phosphodiesterase